MERVTHRFEETTLLAKEFVENLASHLRGEAGATVIALYGDLGSGKTTFVQAAAKALGIDATVISPTFVIERVYKLKNQPFDPMHPSCRHFVFSKQTSENFHRSLSKQQISCNHPDKIKKQRHDWVRGFDHLIHIDCYRIDASKEIATLGWDEKIANPRNLIFVEWAERMEELLPPNTVRIYFEFVGETTRQIKISNIRFLISNENQNT